MKERRNSMKKFRNIKRNFKNKLRSYKLDIEEEIGMQKIKEFFEISIFRKAIKTIKVILMIVGIISGWMTVYSFYVESDDSIAMTNYQRGMNYLEDKNYEEAEKCFEVTYEKNSDLLQIIYYYAYTEFMLKDFEKSHKVLQENKNKLDDNELAFLAMYEYINENFEESQQHIDAVKKPENLEVFAFYVYTKYSIKLGFLNDYNEGLDIFCNNLILLDGKINVAGVFPKKTMNFYPVNGFKPDEKYLKKTINRIETNAKYDKSKYIRTKLYMYFLFLYYSIQYDNIEVPIGCFTDIAETFDYANHPDITKELLIVLLIYACEIEVYPEVPEQMKEAYQIISEHYHKLELLEEENSIKIEEEDRLLFEACGKISKEIDNNSFNPKNYTFDFLYENPEDYKEQDNLLEEWCKRVEYSVDNEWQ